MIRSKREPNVEPPDWLQTLPTTTWAMALSPIQAGEEIYNAHAPVVRPGGWLS